MRHCASTWSASARALHVRPRLATSLEQPGGLRHREADAGRAHDPVPGLGDVRRAARARRRAGHPRTAAAGSSPHRAPGAWRAAGSRSAPRPWRRSADPRPEPTCVSSASRPPGSSTRATLAQPTSGRPSGTPSPRRPRRRRASARAASSNVAPARRSRRPSTRASPRAASIRLAPGSTACTRRPRWTSSSVSLPVPQPISSTARAAVELARRDRRVHDLGRVARPRRVVGLGDPIEDPAALSPPARQQNTATAKLVETAVPFTRFVCTLTDVWLGKPAA